MTKLYPKIILGFLAILCSYFSFAQVSVTATAGTTGPTSYTTLKAAFDAINAGTHKGVVAVSITGNTTETATAVLNPNTAPAGYTAVNIGTSGAFSVSMAAAQALINLNGATNVTINGNNTLQLINTSTSGRVLEFNNNASNNSIKNVTIKGATNLVDANGTPNNGVIKFGTGSISGNDNNSIDNCDIDGTSAATVLVYSSGDNTTTTTQNSGDTLKNCKLHDNINSTITTSIAVFLSGANTGWVIQNNSIYFSTALTTTQQIIVRSMLIFPDYASDAHTITGNFVGGNAANATGTMSLTATGAGILGYIGLDVETGGAGNVVSNNTVKNITITYGNTAGTFSNAGILSSIAGFNGTTSVTGNTVSNISISNTQGYILFGGIHLNGRAVQTGTVTPSFTVSNNTVTGITSNSGNPPTGDVQLTGIRLETSAAGALTNSAISNPLFTISGNTITNISTTYNGAFTWVRGIGTVLTNGTNSSASTALLNPKVDINNNNINSLSSAGTNTAYNTGALIGIYYGGANTTAATDLEKITGNTINNLSATNTVDSGTVTIGILASIGVHDISKNKIFDLKNAASGATKNPGIVGITVRNVVGATTVTNNFISLGTGQTTNLLVAGIMHNFVGATGSVSAYYNTVVISGAGAAGNNKSTFGFLRGTETLANTVTATVNVKNNILYNSRTGGGSHYAIGNTYTTSPTGWSSDYNNLYSTTPATVALWGTTSNDLATYKTNSGDANSKSVVTNFVNVATGDLHLTGSSITDANLKAVPVGGITTDIDGDTRSGTTPFMGADEAQCVSVTITTQPVAQSVCAGSNASLSVTAAGSGLTYQWRKGGNPITGATSSTLSFSPAAAADAGSYDVVITGACGNATSNAVTLTVNTAPVITAQPQTQAVCAGSNASLSVTATGTGLTYQWRKGGTNIAGQTASTLSFTPAAAGDAGTYDVVVSNGTCPVTSSSATLTVAAASSWIGSTSTDWNNAANWCGGVPTSTSDITIPSGTPNSPVVTGTTNNVRNLTIASGATLTVPTGTRLNIYGNYTNNGTMTATAGTIAFQGTTAQTIGALSAGTVIMNGTGVTLSGNLTVGTALTLTAGNITLGANNLTLNGSATGSTSSHIVTNGTGAVTSNNIGTTATVIPVAPDATSYNPVTIANGTGKNYTVKVATGITPAIANPAKAINRTWTITPSAAPGSNVDITLQYADADANASANPSGLMEVSVNNGTIWRIATPAAGVTPTGTAAARIVTTSTQLFGPTIVNNPGAVTYPTAVPNVDADVASAVMMPNLVNANALLRVMAKRSTMINWEITDANGRSVMSFNRQVTAGQNDIQLKLGKLAKGTYQLRGATEKGLTEVIRFVKM